MTDRIYKDVTHKLEVGVIDQYGNFVSGLLVTYEVKRCSDDGIIQDGVLPEIGVTGVYSVPITISINGEYRVKYTTPSGYENGFEDLIVSDAEAIDSTVAKTSGEKGTDSIYNTVSDIDVDEILSKFNMLSSKILASSSKSEIKKLEEALSVIKSKMR